MRAVLDASVLISALISPTGVPAALLRRWLDGEFELIVSSLLLAELKRALAYPKLGSRVMEEEAKAFLDLLQRGATVASDPADPPRRSRDRGDDYLPALAQSIAAMLVSGDADLEDLRDIPIESPRGFLMRLDKQRPQE